MAFPQNLTVQRDKVTEFCDIEAQPTCGDCCVEPTWLKAAYIMWSNWVWPICGSG
jgi:hypothetical protein